MSPVPVTESERRAELAVAAENTAAFLNQHERRLTILETEFESGIAMMKWIGSGSLILLSAILASRWFP